jgi:hypothetical protein
MAMHTIFTYPWITAMFGSDSALATREQVGVITGIVAEAARNIILTARYIDTDAASPAWFITLYLFPPP